MSPFQVIRPLSRPSQCRQGNRCWIDQGAGWHVMAPATMERSIFSTRTDTLPHGELRDSLIALNLA